MPSASFAVLLIALALTLPLGGQVQDRQIGGIGLTVFSDSDFRGRNATFRSDTPDLAPYGLDDRISSLRVGSGEIWEVCELPNYQGRCQVFSGTERSLSRSGWSDTISSVRRVRGGGIFPPIQPPIVGVGLELYAGVRFQGDRRVLTSEVPDLRRIGFNDRTSSIRLGQSQAWEVCVETNYRGCRVIDTDWPDLSGLGMTRRVSSVRPWNQGGGGVRPPFPGVEGRIVLFDERNFRGRSYVVDSVRPLLSGFVDKAESVQVTGGGLWELCERANFGGRCTIVSSNVSDLGALGLRNRVSSARPRPAPYQH